MSEGSKPAEDPLEAELDGPPMPAPRPAPSHDVPHFELDTSARNHPYAAAAATREFDPVDTPDLELAPADAPTAPTAPVTGETELDPGPPVTSSPLETPIAKPPRLPPRRQVLGRMILDQEIVPTPGFWRRIPVALLVPFLGLGGIPWLLAFGALAAALLQVTFWGKVVIGLVSYGSFLVYFDQALRIGVDDVGGVLPKATWRAPTLEGIAHMLPGGLALLALLVALTYLAVQYAPVVFTIPYVLAVSVLLDIYLLVAWTRIGFGGGALAGIDVVGNVQTMFSGGVPFLVIGGFYAIATTAVSVVAGLIVLTAALSGGGVLSMTLMVAGLTAGHAWAAGVSAYLIGRVLDERGAFR